MNDRASRPADNWVSFFEDLPVGAFRSLPNGRLLRVNTALARMVGCAGEADMLARVQDLAVDWYVDPGRRQEVLDRLDRDGSARGLVSETFHQVTRRPMWVSENIYVVRGADDQVAFLEGTIEEVTERVHAHQALQRRETLLRDVTNSMPGMVYRLRVQPGGARQYEFVSGGVRAVYGVEPEALMADPYLLQSLRHPDDVDWVNDALRHHVAAGGSQCLDFRTRTPDGQNRWVRLTSSVTSVDEHGTVLHGVVLDITEAKLAEQALHEADARWKLALESLGDGVWDWDLTRGTGVISGPLREAYGVPPGQLMTPENNLDQRVHPDDLASMLRARTAHVEGRTPAYRHEHRVWRADGRWMWVLTRGLVVQRDAGGRALRLLGTHTDITERREAEALRAQRNRAEAADRAKSELMSRISHELRTPLNAVLGFSQLLDQTATLSEQQRAWLDQVMVSGRHLLSLVDDVLELTTLQSVDFSLQCEPVSLDPAIEASCQMLSRQAADADVAMPTVTPTGLTVMGDARRLRQVLSNLLSNAVKYNRAGGAVTLTGRRDGDQVVIEVSDTGLGIAADRIDKAFQPFERLGASRSNVPGTGLGLSLCRQWVEAMHGTIELRSELGVSTTFTVRLPAAPGD